MNNRIARTTASAAVVLAIAIGALVFAMLSGTGTAYADELVTNVTIGDEAAIGPGESAHGISISADGTAITFEDTDLVLPDDMSANDAVKIESSIPDLVISLIGENSIYCDKQGARGVHIFAYCEDADTIPQYRIAGPGSLSIDVIGHGIFAGNYTGPYFNLTVTDGAMLDIECLLDSEPTPDIAFAGNAIRIAYGGFFVSNGACITAVSDAESTILVGSADKNEEPLNWLRIESGAVLDLENRFACKIEGGLGTVETCCLFYQGDYAVIDNATLSMSSPTKMAYTTNGLMATYAEMSIQNGALVTYCTPEWEDYQGQPVDITAMHGIIAPRLTIDAATVDISIDLSNEPEPVRSAYAVGIAFAWYLDILNGAQVEIDATSNTACGIHWKGNTYKFTNGDITIDKSRVDISANSLIEKLGDTNAVFGLFTHTLEVNAAEPGQGLFIRGSLADENAYFIALCAYWENSEEPLPFDPEYKSEVVAFGTDTGIALPENGICSRYTVLWYGAEEEPALQSPNEHDEQLLNASSDQWGIIDTVFGPEDTGTPAAECAITYIGAKPEPEPTPSPSPAPEPAADNTPATGDTAAATCAALCFAIAACTACVALSARRREER